MKNALRIVSLNARGVLLQILIASLSVACSESDVVSEPEPQLPDASAEADANKDVRDSSLESDAVDSSDQGVNENDVAVEQEAGACDPNPCLQGGSCTIKDGSVACECPAGASGTICENVSEGKARFRVLTSTLLRMEYAEDGVFEDRASFTAMHRDQPVPAFTTKSEQGWREIETGSLTLRYKENSGPFSPKNLTVQLTLQSQPLVTNPWVIATPVPCDHEHSCEAEAARLRGTAALKDDHSGYSGKGFVGGLTEPGASLTWYLQGVPAAGDYTLNLRYANGIGGDLKYETRLLSLYVNGVKTQVSLPTTADWDTWGVLQTSVPLRADTNTLVVSYEGSDTGNVNLDWVLVTAQSAIPTSPIPTPPPELPHNLGGWTRALDTINGEIPLHDGLLTREGWYLLDDSLTAVFSEEPWPVARPATKAGYQDGYFFGYGHDYKRAFEDFFLLSGNPVLLPRQAFGIWFSRYYGYSQGDYKDSLLPAFRAHQTPLDVLVVDTDWKFPLPWNGWSWSPLLFPQPPDFLSWAKQQGLTVSLNIHPSIQNLDPQYSQASQTAGNLVDLGLGRYGWDWAKKSHVQSYLDLHKPYEDQGVGVWWLDWCCEGVPSPLAGLPGDTWINTLYAKSASDRGLRGYAFSRIGSGYESYGGLGQANTAWGDHRSTLHFTGDTGSTWEMLSFQSLYTIREANIGLSYVSHDLGGFHGKTLEDDLYLRWVQFGVFQPVFRLHSDHGERLPWEYANVSEQAAEMLRLRESLIPYVYTIAQESAAGGLPMVRGLYLHYPEATEAYTYDREYLFGSQILVSPVATAGASASVEVWFPPGDWIDWFSATVHTGPGVETVVAGFDSMPVFVKAGGIVPLQSYRDYDGQKPVDPLILRVYPGADGAFTLYEDEGEGLGYLKGERALTPLTLDQAKQSLKIGAQQGTYPGALTHRAYDIVFVRVNKPQTVTVEGEPLSEVAAGSGQGWWYETGNLHVHLDSRATSVDSVITFSAP